MSQRFLLLLAFAVCAAWGGVCVGAFQFDDFANVLLDPATTEPGALFNRLTSGIRPLTRLTYAACAYVFGDWAGGWLLMQLAVHLSAAIALAHLVFLRMNDAHAGFISATIFALAPSHAFVVAYVSGRSTLIASCLLLFALLAHEYGVQRGRRRAGAAGAAALLLLACAAKEVAVIFPALVFLWEATRTPRATWRDALKATTPYALVAIVAVVAMLRVAPRYGRLIEFSFGHRSPLESLLHNLVALPATLSLLVRPWALSVEHTLNVAPAALAAGAMFLTALIALACSQRSRRPLITLALLWPVAALLPTHSFIAKLDAVAEGPLYLAAVGPAIAIGASAAQWLRSAVSKAAAHAALAAVLVVAASTCVWRTYVWGDPVRLWRDAIAQAPDSSRAWTNLGVALIAANQPAAARDALRTSLEIDADNVLAAFHLEFVASLINQPAE